LPVAIVRVVRGWARSAAALLAHRHPEPVPLVPDGHR
jgi:hypothetical protein